MIVELEVVAPFDHAREIDDANVTQTGAAQGALEDCGETLAYAVRVDVEDDHPLAGKTAPEMSDDPGEQAGLPRERPIVGRVRLRRREPQQSPCRAERTEQTAEPRAERAVFGAALRMEVEQIAIVGRALNRFVGESLGRAQERLVLGGVVRAVLQDHDLGARRESHEREELADRAERGHGEVSHPQSGLFRQEGRELLVLADAPAHREGIPEHRDVRFAGSPMSRNVAKAIRVDLEGRVELGRAKPAGARSEGVDQLVGHWAAALDLEDLAAELRIETSDVRVQGTMTEERDCEPGADRGCAQNDESEDGPSCHGRLPTWPPRPILHPFAPSLDDFFERRRKSSLDRAVIRRGALQMRPGGPFAHLARRPAGRGRTDSGRHTLSSCPGESERR